MAMVTVMFQGETVGSYTIKHHPFVIGRDAGNDVHIDNIGVSREHCQFVYDNKHFNIQDLGSANGTLLHGQKIRMSPITDGDEIKMGKYTLIFHQAPGEGSPPPKGGTSGTAAMAPVAAEEQPAQKGFTGERTLMVQGAAFAAPATESSGPRRASEVARKFQPEQASAGSSKTVWIVVIFMGVLVLGLAATVVALILSKS